MTNKNFSIIEGKKHKIYFNLSNVEEESDFQVFGFFKKIGCCNSVFELEEINNEKYIPELENGTYTYQVFVKQLSTNKDFLALEGKIEVKNSLMVENNSSLGGTELEITFDANTTEIHCEIGQGLRGEKGEKGDKGDKGEKGEDGTNILSKNNTWTGNNFFNYGIKALPLGNNLYGLSVSADDGLQLWGTHFLQGDAHAENTLKIVHNSISLGSADFAAIGFDYANTVTFRTFPNDGSTANDSAGGVYRFEAWQWADDSHTSKKEMAVDVRKPNAGVLCDESLMNRAEVLAAIEENATMPDLPIAADKNDVTAPIASGKNSTALGYNANASGEKTTALGYKAQAKYIYASAIGFEAFSESNYGVSLGHKTKTVGNSSIAIGKNANATGYYSMGLGADTLATARASMSLGYKAQAKDVGVTVIAAWDFGELTQTLLYLIGANSPLATTYENGAACMGYVVKDRSGNILECGTRKLSEIFTNNTTFAPASLDLDSPAPKVF